MVIPETILKKFAEWIGNVYSKICVFVCNWWHSKSSSTYIILATATIIVLRNAIKPQLLALLILFLLVIIVIKILFGFLLIISYISLPLFGKRYCERSFIDGKGVYKVINHLSNKYAAVLISNNQSSSLIKGRVRRYWKNNMVNAAIVFIPLLVTHFQKNNMNYKIVQSVTKEDFDYAVDDPNCEELYLVGHGSRGRFKLSETIVNYSEYVGDVKEKKRIVSQLHCNGIKRGEKNISLTELLATNQKDSFLKNRNIELPDIIIYCWKMSRK